MSSLTSPPGRNVRRDPVEDGGAGREREPGEQRAAGAADAEGDRDREPEQADERGRGRVGDVEVEHAEDHAAEAGDRRPTGRRS